MGKKQDKTKDDEILNQVQDDESGAEIDSDKVRMTDDGDEVQDDIEEEEVGDELEEDEIAASQAPRNDDGSQNDDGDEDSEIEELKGRVDSLESQLKRAVADYANLEKRVSEGRMELAAWATSEFVTKMLPVLDNLEMAVKGASEEDRKSGWFKGVEMSVKQMQQLLQNEGLEQIQTDGQFDPALHEAVDTKEGKEGEVLEILRKGYNLNGKVVRPAQVVVGRKN